MSESRIAKSRSPIKDTNCSYERCLTESSAGGIFLYISNHLSYKPRIALCIDKPTELNSTFVKVLGPKKIIFIEGCIYHQSHMDLITITFVIYWISYQRKTKLFSFLVTLT